MELLPGMMFGQQWNLKTKLGAMDHIYASNQEIRLNQRLKSQFFSSQKTLRL